MSKNLLCIKIKFYTIIFTKIMVYVMIFERIVHKNVEMWITHVVFFTFSQKNTVCININCCE